jgi:hypothetical protein
MFFNVCDSPFAKVVNGSTNVTLFRQLCTFGEKDPNVSFTIRGGTPASRRLVLQAILVFTQHTAQTPMPAVIGWPGVADPGAGVALPLTYSTYFGLFHLIASLTQHPAGAQTRGRNITLEVTPQGHDMFSVELL